MIPWALYNLTPRDQASALLRPYHENQGFTAIAGAVTQQEALFTIPSDTVLLLSHASAWLSVGGGSSFITFQIQDLDHLGVSHLDTRFYSSSLLYNAEFDAHLTASPVAVVSDHQRVRITVNKPSAGAAWNCGMSCAGVLIPRGTFALS